MRKYKDSFVIVMPVLNEESYIEKTILSWNPVVQNIPGSEILVIDGGSKDSTLDKLKVLSESFNFVKVINQKDKGHGNAIRQGYEFALKTPHPWIFQADADGHINPIEFNKLWQRRSKSDFILGHRQKRADSIYRLVLSRLISIWILILFGTYIKDPNIPFRLIRKRYLR